MKNLAGAVALVTGANGFIGSHLVERLLREGAHVRALCLYNENGSLGWLDDVTSEAPAGLDARLGDIRDPRFVADLVDGVDIVFHLAALVSIPYSYEAPISFVETNIGGTMNVLEAARRSGTPLVVHTSTSEVYGTPHSVPISEDHPLVGQSPYSATKIGADKMCEAYAASFDVPVVTLRPFNTYGPRQSLRAVIPTILGQLLSGASEVRLGSLEPKRDFTFVEDTVDGFIRMATADVAPGSTIQLGTGESISVADLFALCCEVVGSDARPVSDPSRVRPPRSEVQLLLSDPRRARELLGWKPQVPLRDGLERTANFLRGTSPGRVQDYHR